MLTIRTSFDTDSQKKTDDKKNKKIRNSAYSDFMPKQIDRESDHNLKIETTSNEGN